VKKSTGRPRKSNRPKVDWNEIDKRLVHGDPVVDAEQGTVINYPSYRDLAKEYKTSTCMVARHAKKHNCLQRREQAKKHFFEAKDKRLAEFRADSVAVVLDDQLRMINSCLLQFEEETKERKHEITPTDFNTLSRLKLVLEGNAETRQEIMGGLTIDELQRRHREYLDDCSRITPEMTGMVIERNEGDREEEDPDEGEGDRPLPSKPTIH
jgi:hypothetical protein